MQRRVGRRLNPEDTRIDHLGKLAYCLVFHVDDDRDTL